MPKTYPGMRAGQLRERLIIQKRTDVVDSAGDFAPSWQTIGRERASVTQILGFRRTEIEGIFGQQIVAAASYKVEMRFRDDVTPKHRLVVFSKAGQPDTYLNILALADLDGRRRRLTCICESGLVDG